MRCAMSVSIVIYNATEGEQTDEERGDIDDIFFRKQCDSDENIKRRFEPRLNRYEWNKAPVLYTEGSECRASQSSCTAAFLL